MISLIKDEIKKFREFLSRFYFSANNNKKLIDSFHKFYYDSSLHRKTMWFGIPVWKIPFDLWIYQEIIYELKPDLIIETGTAYGGSAYYMANLLDLIGKGKIITIDINNKLNRPNHKRIIYLTGSSVSKEIIDKLTPHVKNSISILVILDSDHKKEHVLKEMNLYSRFVTLNSYLIVEDTNINGNPVYKEYGPGPMEAVKVFLKNNKNFIIDKTREKFYVSFNPNGYLKKIK